MKRLSQKTVESNITRSLCSLFGLFCKNSGDNFIQFYTIVTSLQQEAEANGQNGDFFKEKCVDTTNDIFSCSEPCDGVYRTFSGCCNNLINKQYGQIVKFEHQKNSFKILYRKGECSPKEVPPSSLPFKQNSAQGGTGQLFSS